MNRIAITLAASVIAAPAIAKDVTLNLSDKEQQALRQIFDLALRQGGLQVAGNVQYFITKMAAPPVSKVQTNGVKPDGTVVNDELVKPRP